MRKNINIESDNKEIERVLESRQDADGLRMKRFLDMPDLARTEGSPLFEMAQRIIDIKRFSDFDVINVPEIVPADISFDLFNFPADHPARSKSDTYYVDDNMILRTHTTVMWYYYFNLPEVKERITKGEALGALSYGKVYRKDEIDRNHMNVFHQMDGLYVAKKSDHLITIEDLKEVLSEIAKSVFGQDIVYRFNEDKFPYTHPSLEMEIQKDDKWIEVLGAGVVMGSVLDNLGVSSEEYNGWAFGFGLERLAIISMELPDIRLLWSSDERVKKQLKLGNKFIPVSKYPPITRDISFIVSKDFIPNNYFDLIRDLGGDLVEEVQLLDKYENDSKFGSDRMSYTYRIIYRSPDKTLTSEEVDAIQSNIYNQTKELYKAELR